ncbi:hypothetical protein BI347_03430 [Chromobacterium sphagni]|uniref:Uncharacterized protein n=1 Tax=Chromobacterium sphagni TaxID=1903179 RepID=A0A1S1X007_9NEIS|nr:hypothetical protein BI347_03430 [Chromobacterium sphagni]OHX21208.1 hypothetical protein BI344_01325 [Chromobacterium sphagni]
MILLSFLTIADLDLLLKVLHCFHDSLRGNQIELIAGTRELTLTFRTFFTDDDAAQTCNEFFIVFEFLFPKLCFSFTFFCKPVRGSGKRKCP